MTSPVPLRERLAAARYDEDLILVEDALKAFRDWLCDETTADLMAAETTEFHWLQIDADQCACGEWREDETGLIHDRHVARAGLAFLAGTLDKEITNGR